MTTTATTESSFAIHAPNSAHPSLADGPGGFDRTWFMGSWNVAWSTLPMWKDKKGVVIRYEPVAQESKINTTFSSVVEYHKQSAAKDSKPSTVRGTETLSAGMNGANFDWKGASYLFFVHSHWEILGYGKEDMGGSGYEWALTFFSQTLFTPAGIDIYVRPIAGTAQPDADGAQLEALVNKVVQAIQTCPDEGVKTLAKGGFDVPPL